MSVAVGFDLVLIASRLLAALFALAPFSTFALLATSLALPVAFVGIRVRTSALLLFPSSSRVVALAVSPLTVAGIAVVPELAGFLLYCIQVAGDVECSVGISPSCF